MLTIYRQEYNRILSHAKASLPNEACGLLAGFRDGNGGIITKVYCLSNTDQSPEHFSMDPKEQFSAVADMRAKGITLLGNFHSHPETPARPSAEDISLAFDPEMIYMIVSLKDNRLQLKCFSILQGNAVEKPYVVLENETAEI